MDQKQIGTLKAVSETLKSVVGLSHRDRYNLIITIGTLDKMIEELKKGDTHGNNTDTDK